MEIERNGRRNVSRELLTVAELQRYLNLGRTKTYELIASREILLSGDSHRAFLTAISDGIASIEGYINYQAVQIGTQQYKDCEQQKVSFETKINEWIPQITGGKLDKGGVYWIHHQKLRRIRNDYQAHPKTPLYGIPYSEICRRMNLFRTGIARLLFDLHRAFNRLVRGK